MKKVVPLILLIMVFSNSYSQIRLIEVDPTTDFVTIKNFGGSTVDISTYRLCALIVYTPPGGLSALNLESGDLNLAPGQTVTVSGWSLATNSDLGLYLPTGGFHLPANMVDFTQWGAGGLGRESVAVSKGIWTAGDFIEAVPPYNYNGDGTQNGLDFWQVLSSAETDILSYSFAEQTGSAIIDAGNHTINIEVEFETDLTNLVASFTLSDGATANVDIEDQESGTTVNDFSSPVTYNITAEDGTTKQDWIVTVSEHQPPNTETDFLTYSLPEPVEPAVINAVDHTISMEVGNGTNVSSLIAIFTTSEGATAEIASTIQESGASQNDFTNPVIYRITAEDGTTFQDWTVTLTIVPNDDTDIVDFSFVEQTKSAIINLVEHTVDLEVEPGTDISGLVADFELSFGAEAVVNSVMQISGTSVLDFTNPVVYTITADDDITTQDWLVTVIFDPQTDFVSFSFPEETGSKEINTADHIILLEVEFGTDLSTLIANFTLSEGAMAEINGTQQVSGQTINNFSDPLTYTIISSGGINVQNWVVTLTFGPSPETVFLTYSLPEQTGPSIININDQTVTVEVSFDTDVTSLASTFTLSEGASAKVNSIEQQSMVSINDFTAPVIYQITAEDGLTIQEWIVTVTFGPNTGTDFLSFSLPGETAPAIINPVNHIIDVEVSHGTDLTGLIASFTLSEGASISVDEIQQESGITSNDFSSALIYTVTAQDATTVQNWSVCTVVDPNTEAKILNFSFTEETAPSVIDEITSQVIVEVEEDADITNLIASFTLSEGARVEVNGIIQESGVTSNDFSGSVIYEVIAEDGNSLRDWTILVTPQNITSLGVSYSEQLQLYPNPVSNYLTLKFNNEYFGLVTLNIRDMTGKKMVSKQYQKYSQFFEQSIDLLEFDGPIIIVELIIEGDKMVRRIVIE